MLPSPFDTLPKSAQRSCDLLAGTALFHQGNPTRGLFYLQTGQVHLERTTEQGDDILIHREKPNETFAEASLFSAGYHCNAVIVEDSHLIELKRREVLARFQTDPHFAVALADRFAKQVQGYRRRLELVAIRRADERVFAALADGGLEDGIKTFASEIGLTHEATYRALAKLVKKQRIYKMGRGKYSLSRP